MSTSACAAAVNAGEECENVVTGRRGLSGTVFVHKVAGAAAGAGASLADVAQEAAAAAAAVGSMGVAISSCVVPGGRRDAERLAGDSVEVGLGIHGEPGRAKQALCPADELVGQLVGRILAVLAPPPRVALMVNNLGGTSVLETHIVARAAAAALRAAGHDVARVYTGAFMTSLEMAGVLLSVLALDEPRLARLDAPAAALAWPAVSFAGRGADASRVAPIVAAAPTAAGGDDAGAGATSEAQTARAAACVRAACGAAIAAEGALTRLDQTVGDGDCGATFRRGAQAVLDALPSYAGSSPGQLCASMGATVRDVIPPLPPPSPHSPTILCRANTVRRGMTRLTSTSTVLRRPAGDGRLQRRHHRHHAARRQQRPAHQPRQLGSGPQRRGRVGSVLRRRAWRLPHHARRAHPGRRRRPGGEHPRADCRGSGAGRGGHQEHEGPRGTLLIHLRRPGARHPGPRCDAHPSLSPPPLAMPHQQGPAAGPKKSIP